MNPHQIANLCVVMSFIPSYLWYANRMTHGGEEALAVILIPLVFYFAKNVRRSKKKNDWISLAGISLYAICWLFHLPAMIKAVIAITILLHHFGLIRNFGITALAYLSLPWLSSFQFFLGYPLRRLVTQLSGGFLSAVGIDAEAEGTGIIYHNQHVFVDPPCSGVNMLWAGFILSAVLCVFFRLTWKKGLLLFSCAGITLIFVNAIRGSILFFPESKLVHWPDWTHEGVGMALYCLSLIFLISLTQKLSPRHA